jgi:hypothetical protein
MRYFLADGFGRGGLRVDADFCGSKRKYGNAAGVRQVEVQTIAMARKSRLSMRRILEHERSRRIPDAAGDEIA